MWWREQIYSHHVENLPRGHLQHPSISALNEGHLLGDEQTMPSASDQVDSCASLKKLFQYLKQGEWCALKILEHSREHLGLKEINTSKFTLADSFLSVFILTGFNGPCGTVWSETSRQLLQTAVMESLRSFEYLTQRWKQSVTITETSHQFVLAGCPSSWEFNIHSSINTIFGLLRGISGCLAARAVMWSVLMSQYWSQLC